MDGIGDFTPEDKPRNDKRKLSNRDYEVKNHRVEHSRKPVGSLIRAHDEPAFWTERQPNEPRSREHELGIRLRRQPVDTARTRERFHNEQHAVRVEPQALRTTERTTENG